MVDLLLQLVFPVLVVPLRRENVRVLGGIGSDHDGLQRALHQRCAGRKTVHDKGDEEKQRAAQEEGFLVAFDKSLSGLLCTRRKSFCLCRALRRGLALQVAAPDRALLLPAGQGMGGQRLLPVQYA